MMKKPAKVTRKVGKYTIVSKIAQGGMGAVYKAKHPTLKRFVLLKKLTLRGGPQFIERFRREARIMMDFKHDHIVQVYDHFKDGSSYYIAEEFVDGVSLEQLIKRERYLSNEAAALIFYEVCKALRHAHEKGVVHRDMKPGNILISNQGEVKLVDFGIATSREDSEEGLTRDGMTLGTPSYIPPEQIDNAKSVDRRADIYSLGVVLYEMLTG
jgi:serine/threonine-protein kinase